LIILLIWWCRRKGYSVFVKLDQKAKVKEDPTTYHSTPTVLGSSYKDEPELAARTGSVVERPELSGQGRHVAEMQGPTNGAGITELGTADTRRDGDHGSAQLSRSDTVRFREVESGFARLKRSIGCEHMKYMSK